MKIVFTLLLVTFHFANGECLVEHLEKAIALNKHKKTGYAQLSNNQSLILSTAMIWGESLALQYAKVYQKKATNLHKKNIQLFCDELLPMSLVSRNVTLTSPSINDFMPMIFSDEYSDWKELIKTHSWNQLSTQLHQNLSQNSEPREYNCLTRHFIEALMLFSDKASAHNQMSLDNETQKELNQLTANFMTRMLLLLKLTPFIDKKASSLQKKGIPIICNDIPWVQI